VAAACGLLACTAWGCLNPRPDVDPSHFDSSGNGGSDPVGNAGGGAGNSNAGEPGASGAAGTGNLAGGASGGAPSQVVDAGRPLPDADTGPLDAGLEDSGVLD
jgi:hypothetical protein